MASEDARLTQERNIALGSRIEHAKRSYHQARSRLSREPSKVVNINYLWTTKKLTTY
jgi:hypothetical protein